MDQGYEVYVAKKVVGIFLHNKLVYQGFYDSQRKLFQINIMDLILPSSPPHQSQIHDDVLIGSDTSLRLSPDAHVESDDEEADTRVPATFRKKRKNEWAIPRARS